MKRTKLIVLIAAALVILSTGARAQDAAKDQLKKEALLNFKWVERHAG